jgi:pimeloyl-ACP methyl ester carboxylesterase
MFEVDRRQIRTGDGHLLDVELAGPKGGRSLIFHTGTPSAGSLFEAMIELGVERGLRHISYSRPGYGGSDRHPGRSVADCASDVQRLAEELEIEQFFTVGASGGGPHALACAALLPDRTLAAATLAGVAPFEAAGLDWLAGMGEENLDEFAATLAGEEALLEYLEPAAAGLRGASAEDIGAEMGDLLSPVDQAALSGAFAEYMARTTAMALQNGPWGWLDDDLAFARPWGFEVAAIEVPVTVWQGGEDRFVPFAHGEWLAANIPGAHPRLLPREGHLSIVVGSYGAVLDDLLARAEAPS